MIGKHKVYLLTDDDEDGGEVFEFDTMEEAWDAAFKLAREQGAHTVRKTVRYPNTWEVDARTLD